MRITLTLTEDAFVVARQMAARECVPLGDAVSELICAGAGVRCFSEDRTASPLRGRFALLPARDEVITPAQVRTLMEREGI